MIKFKICEFLTYWLKIIDLFHVNPFFFFLQAIIKSWIKQLKIKLENVSFKHLEKNMTCLKKAVSASVTLSFALTLTWDDRYSFQGSKNSERSQRRHTTQIHKLCYISETWRVRNQTLPDIQHTGRSRHRVAVGFKGQTDVAHLNVFSAYLELLKSFSKLWVPWMCGELIHCLCV